MTMVVSYEDITVEITYDQYDVYRKLKTREEKIAFLKKEGK